MTLSTAYTSSPPSKLSTFQRPEKLKAKHRVAFTRRVPPPEPGKAQVLPEQETFFCTNRQAMKRHVAALLSDYNIDSVYVDDFNGEVLTDKVRF